MLRYFVPIRYNSRLRNSWQLKKRFSTNSGEKLKAETSPVTTTDAGNNNNNKNQIATNIKSTQYFYENRTFRAKFRHAWQRFYDKYYIYYFRRYKGLYWYIFFFLYCWLVPYFIWKSQFGWDTPIFMYDYYWRKWRGTLTEQELLAEVKQKLLIAEIQRRRKMGINPPLG